MEGLVNQNNEPISWKEFQRIVAHSASHPDRTIDFKPFLVEVWETGLVTVGDLSGKELFLVFPDGFAVPRLIRGESTNALIWSVAKFLLTKISEEYDAPLFYWNNLLRDSHNGPSGN